MTDEGVGVSRRGDVTVESLVPEDWRVAWDSSPALIVVTLGPSHRLAYQNRAVQAMFGVRPLGVRLTEAFPELVTVGLAPLDGVLETGAVVDVPARAVAVRDVAGGQVCLRYVLAPLGAPAIGVVITAIDVTAEARAEETAERVRLLADISTRITAARSAGEGLQSLTDGLVPTIADVAAVYVTPDVTAADTGAALPPEVVSLSTRLSALGPLPRPSARDRPAPWGALLAAGNAVLLPLDESTLHVVAPDPETAAWLRAAEGNSIAVVPLVVAGSLSGALVLLTGGDRPPFGESDLPFLQDVTARAAIAISQVRSTRQHRDIALRLQRALLPPAPPALRGFTIVARYVAGAPQVQVGGDWWDVQGVGDGHLPLRIRDVAGRGLRAAAVMGPSRAA
jgi:GAF domain-containing protein